MFVQPNKITEQSFVEIGMKVADVGCGIGLQTFELARAVGPLGRVYAIDVAENLLMALRNEAQLKKFNNIIVLLANAEKNTGLEGDSLDRVFSVTVSFSLRIKMVPLLKRADF
jgi:ubiquinone/menaquinone biosynthesis C-methylase UbiE